MVRLLRMRHSEHAAPHQWRQVMAPEEGPVCQSELAHHVSHGARYVAEHYDLPLILSQVLKPLRLVTDQPSGCGINLVTDQVCRPFPDLCSEQVRRFLLNLVSQGYVLFQVFGRFVFNSSLQHDPHLARLFALGEFVQVRLETVLHFCRRRR